MAKAKRKVARPAPQARTYATRSRGGPPADPAENTQQLNQQLRALGLYAASTLGDGNCLFRALSDQLYGTDGYHLSLRQAICNWIESHKHRYAPFVDDERGLEVHLQCMRQQATYGGHLELSAFAHMMRRNVKVVQPGLVYVIEWDAGGDPALDPPGSPPSTSAALPSTSAAAIDDDPSLSGREKRKLKRDQKRSVPHKPPPDLPEELPEQLSTTVYVAYHNYEHFSSIRNLRGPHAGPPNVGETLAPDEYSPPPSPPVRKPPSRVKAKALRPTSRTGQSKKAGSATPTPPEPIPPPLPPPLTPAEIPLPPSRSPSPDLCPHAHPSMLPATPTNAMRSYRSPKRTFDESSASSEDSQSLAKRPKSHLSKTDSLPLVAPTSTPDEPDMDVNLDIDDPDLDTPSLSAASPASSSSLSSVPSPAASPPPEPEPATQPQRPMTRRQRKQLGLPKPRQVLVGKVSAGKIVIPGGKYKASGGKGRTGQEEEEEWQRNGTGRVDVRGFRELKI